MSANLRLPSVGQGVRTDPDVPIQPSGDDASDQSKRVPDRLPRKGGDALVRDGEGELALERVHVHAKHHVHCADQELGAALSWARVSTKEKRGKVAERG